MDIPIYFEEALQVTVAFLAGAIIGFERELRSKPAGFRTMILICVGSCVFTILSKQSSQTSPDRIASNIVTGIGFIGAGVIFKEGFAINGLTSAALIWVAAALGMSIGYHDYPLAATVTAIVVIVLFILEPFQRVITHLHRVRSYKLKVSDPDPKFVEQLETFFKTGRLKFKCTKVGKENDDGIYIYRVTSPSSSFEIVNQYLLQHPKVRSFDAG